MPQEQESQPQRKGPPAGWRYPAPTKHRSRLGRWFAEAWREVTNNAGLLSLYGVLITLLVNAMLAQQEDYRQQEVENRRAQAEFVVAEQQAQQESLQTYLGDMGELILRDTSPLPEASPDDAVSRLARAKTLTILASLDEQRKSGVLQFLMETGLIQRVEGKRPIIALSDADLNGADLRDANLNGAYLSGADLSGARGITEEQIEQQAFSLKGATMPDESKHPYPH